jgi:cation diffusion facilitator CzcD-associated flavoprotein CzcO
MGNMADSRIVVIGGGPYGLATTAHLRAAGLETRLIGPRMQFWRRHMPQGMLLRSPWQASSISDPRGSLTLDDYQSAQGETLARPIPLQDFLRYARWFGGQVAPDQDERRVVALERADGGYRLTLDDGEVIEAARVVLATGLDCYDEVPPQLAGLDRERVFHASKLCELDPFAGRRVVVVGAGQSAVESAVLLSEAGADVELLARVPTIRWLHSSSWLHSRPGPIRRMLYPPTDVGPPGLNQITARPRLFQSFPLALQERIAYRSIRPAAASWLEPRVGKVTVTTGRTIASAGATGDGVALTLADGSARSADYVVMATGYRVDLARHPLMTPELLASLDLFRGAPRLRRGFESSLPGLHFVGAMAAQSFGPLMRFVSGTTYAAPAVAAEAACSVPKLAPLRPRLVMARPVRECS